MRRHTVSTNETTTIAAAEVDLRAKEKMGKAKARLILEQPFFATIVCNMALIEDRNLAIKTMATNGKEIRYDPDFVNGLTFGQVQFVLCHEAMHIVFDHMFRRGPRNPMGWNIAGDYIINELLKNENVGEMPASVLYDATLTAKGGNTTEGVYDLLDKQARKSGGWGQPGAPGSGQGQHGNGPLDWVDDCPGSAADQAAAQAETKVMVAQAAQAAKMCGKLSAGLERFVDEALQPKVDWRDVLRRFVQSRAKIDYSFARPKRRFLSDDLYLPSLDGHSLGALAVFVDCSGSISDRELSEFSAEIKAIWEDNHPTELNVIYFDSKVSHHDKFSPGEEVTIAHHGGGGTAFSPLFRFVEDNDIEPVAGIVLTDLCCSDFGPPPGYPVLWVANMDGSAPWGEVVLMNPKRS